MNTAIDQVLIDKVQQFVISHFESQIDAEKEFHNVITTQEVVDAVKEITAGSTLNDADIEKLVVAAWFYGVVDSKTSGDNGSQAEVAAKFLRENNYTNEDIELVLNCIEATNNEFVAETELQKVMKDAVNWYLSAHGFVERASLLRGEKEHVLGEKFSDLDWFQYCERSLLKHTYLTDYALGHYEEGKEKNLLKVRNNIKKLNKKQDLILEKELQVDEAGLKEMKKKLVKASGRPERGIETLFRLTSKNHYTLNAAVDTKSNILISINSIILSIVLGTMLGKIEEDPHLLVPIIMLSATNLWAIALAVFATRPNLTHGKFSMEEVKKGNTNLLFYGNFHKMSLNEYLGGLNNLMNQSDSLYDSIGKDIYFMGVLLNKKFTLLRASFNIFVFGFIASVLVFIACHLFFGETPMF